VNLYDFFTANPVRGFTLDNDAFTVQQDGKTLHVPANMRCVVSDAPGKKRIDFSPEPRLDVGWGMSAPIRLEAMPDGAVFGVGSRLGITKRVRLQVMEEGS
jgi:hypothetical protein